MSATDDALLAALEPLLEAALEPGTTLPADPDAPLSLRSIEVVTLVDLLESSFDLHFTSDDVRPERFATRNSLVALLREKGARCE